MPKPSLTGVVVSQGKMDKTVKVQIRKQKWNRVVSKYVTDFNNMLVHDELNKCREGDVVRIQYVRPLSARKSWAVAEIMKLKGSSWQRYHEVIPAQVRENELAKLQQFREISAQRAARDGEDPTVLELRELENAFSETGDVSPERLAELKEKYQLESWPPAVEKLELDLGRLENEIDELAHKVAGTESYSAEARRIMASEPERVSEILASLGKDASTLKPGIQRNLIAKYLKNHPA